MALTRSVRNRLSELLLTAFADAGKREALRWLATFCALAGKRPPPHQVGLAALMKAGGVLMPAPPSRTALRQLIGEARFLMVHGATRRWPGRTGGAQWVTPTPDVQEAFRDVCSQVRAYERVLRTHQMSRTSARPGDPLGATLVEAALCFNAGLFFEAHEHLEGIWRVQAAGPLKQALQGLIQISVGFHHARQRRYDGTMNLLGRGLAKLRGNPGGGAGLVSEEFLAKVDRVRERVRSRGRERMHALPLREIPHMAIRSERSSFRGAGLEGSSE